MYNSIWGGLNTPKMSRLFVFLGLVYGLAFPASPSAASCRPDFVL